MADREKVIKGLECCLKAYENLYDNPCKDCPYEDFYNVALGECIERIQADALELLKEQEKQVKQWTKEIADNQLAHSPNDSHEFMTLDEHLENEYKRGIWDGLQIAWNIISEGR